MQVAEQDHEIANNFLSAILDEQMRRKRVSLDEVTGASICYKFSGNCGQLIGMQMR